jgi:hypothetical protein
MLIKLVSDLFKVMYGPGLIDRIEKSGQAAGTAQQAMLSFAYKELHSPVHLDIGEFLP